MIRQTPVNNWTSPLASTISILVWSRLLKTFSVQITGILVWSCLEAVEPDDSGGL
jgi:hypothetical protein